MKPSRRDNCVLRGPRGVIVLGVDGRIRCAGSVAVDCLTKYFPHTDVSERLPRKLDRWLAGKTCRTQALVLQHNGSRLMVTMVAAEAREPICLVLEEFAVQPRNGNSNKLTARETEVLSWVAKGKANWAISRILGLSPGTVRKHLQNIYAKLGVENRTAAAICAVEILRSIGQDWSSFS